MTLIKVKKEEAKKLQKIQMFFESAQDLWHELPTELQTELDNIHRPQNNLSWCIRWGQTATEEISELIEVVK